MTETTKENKPLAHYRVERVINLGDYSSVRIIAGLTDVVSDNTELESALKACAVKVDALIAEKEKEWLQRAAVASLPKNENCKTNYGEGYEALVNALLDESKAGGDKPSEALLRFWIGHEENGKWRPGILYERANDERILTDEQIKVLKDLVRVASKAQLIAARQVFLNLCKTKGHTPWWGKEDR